MVGVGVLRVVENKNLFLTACKFESGKGIIEFREKAK